VLLWVGTGEHRWACIFAGVLYGAGAPLDGLAREDAP
jgi:hypothetical protein